MGGLRIEPSLGLSQEESDQFFVESVFIRLISHGEIQPCLFIHNGFVVGEGVEAGLSVVCTHAAFSYTAEGQFTGCKMDDDIVHTATAVG